MCCRGRHSLSQQHQCNASLERAALLTSMMESASNILGGLVLVAAGLYQWTPFKDACLSHCRSPLDFIMKHGGFRRQITGALALGFRHGLYCIGCCWAVMALLFVGGVMNLLWIAALAALVLLENVMPFGRYIARFAGRGCCSRMSSRNGRYWYKVDIY
jgi:predicted metal-binding membrane protein